MREIAGVAIDPNDPPTFESQPAYLKRLGLWLAKNGDCGKRIGSRRAYLEWNKGTVASRSPLSLFRTQRYPELRCLDGRCTGRAFQCLGDSLNASFRLCHRLQCANVVFRPCTANNFLLGQMTAPFLGERPSNIPSHDCNACLRS